MSPLPVLNPNCGVGGQFVEHGRFWDGVSITGNDPQCHIRSVAVERLRSSHRVQRTAGEAGRES